jgi:hypothetical protein
MGNILYSQDKSNLISIFDPRASSAAQSHFPTSFALNRPSTSVFLDDTTILITGTRDRSYNPVLATYDLRSPDRSLLDISLPTSSPSTSFRILVDIYRRLGYLTGRNTSYIHGFDLNIPNPASITLTLTSSILDAALLPPTEVNVMNGEINRIFALGKETVVPVSVRIERKVVRVPMKLIVELYGLP